ncbi:MAG: ATP-dependent DNA helicase [Nanoarchaeota archaeon]
MDYFPYPSPRSTQKEFMQFLEEALESKQHAIIHAPTGCGKTAAALTPSLAHALRNNKTIFFVTSKHTQHTIVLDTIRKIKEKYNINIKVADFIGKKWMCLQSGVTELSAGEFGEFCRDHVTKNICTYYENIKSKGLPSPQTRKALNTIGNEIMSVEQTIKTCSTYNVCPYEVTALHAQKANIIIADYFHVINPSIQEAIFKKTNKDIKNTIIIFDEAHNLPDRVRDLLTVNTSTFVIDQAAKEARQQGYQEVADTVEKINGILEDLAGKIPLQQTEALVQRNEFEEKIQNYEELIDNMQLVGEQILENQRRSFANSLSIFLKEWKGPDNAFTRIITRTFTKRGKPSLVLTYRGLDPGLLLKPLAENAQIICMSGTLTPTDMYQDLFGFKAEKIELPDPFPKQNRLNLIIPEVTTKFTHRDDTMYRRIAGLSAMLVNTIPGNSVVFFPSYKLRDDILPYFSKLCQKTTFEEQPNLSKSEREELITKFKSYSKTGAVLMGISNASFGEGIDLPGDYLKGVLIVGLPLGKPDLETQELIRYYDNRFGKGWEYGYTFPALIRCLQNAGRCIRSETDRGVILFLDDRYNFPQYKKFFPKEWEMQTTEDPVKKVKEFFEIQND